MRCSHCRLRKLLGKGKNGGMFLCRFIYITVQKIRSEQCSFVWKICLGFPLQEEFPRNPKNKTKEEPCNESEKGVHFWGNSVWYYFLSTFLLVEAVKWHLLRRWFGSPVIHSIPRNKESSKKKKKMENHLESSRVYKVKLKNKTKVRYCDLFEFSIYMYTHTHIYIHIHYVYHI